MIIVTVDFSLYIDYINDYLENNIDWDLNRSDCQSLGMLMLVLIITDINDNDYVCYDAPNKWYYEKVNHCDYTEDKITNTTKSFC